MIDQEPAVLPEEEVRRLYLAYLAGRPRLHLPVALLIATTVLVLLAAAMTFVLVGVAVEGPREGYLRGGEAWAVVLPALGVWPLALYAGWSLWRQMRTPRRARDVVEDGRLVQAQLVQANQHLFRPGPYAELPCLVVFTFSGGAEQEPYLGWLAEQLMRLKGSYPADPQAAYLARLTTDERAERYRRRPLPPGYAGAPDAYCADLYIRRAYLRGGCLSGRRLVCFAEPGATGGLELVPWWALEGRSQP